MKIEDQVCTSGQGIMLKSLGIAQKSLFYRHPELERPAMGGTKLRNNSLLCNQKDKAVSAFTASEIMVMLDNNLGGIDCVGSGRDIDRLYMQTKMDGPWEDRFTYYDNLAQCLADKLIFSLQKEWVSTEKANKRLLK